MNAAMRASDFKPCAACGKGVAHTGVPVFWRVHIERMGIDGVAVRQTVAMEDFFLGNIAIARAFQDPEIAKPLDKPTQVLICEACALESRLPLAVIAEKGVPA